MRSRTLKIFFSVCLMSILTAMVCQARDVTLQWDPSTDSTVTGYKLYYNADSSVQPYIGTGSGQGASPVNTLTQATATLTGLDPNKTYYFAATAYDASGAESLYSNIVTVSEAIVPIISITAPASNSSIAGTVSVTASASDNVGVTKIEFYLNGVLKATDTATPYVYSLSSSTLPAGTNTLMAKAYDAAGNVGQSSDVYVTAISDTIAPTVALTSPLNNAALSGTATLSASATDNLGVSKVEFYANGTLLYASNMAPYSYSWNTATVTNGSYTLTARAYDNSGNVTQSGSALVTVSNIAVVVPVAIPQTAWKLQSVDSQELVGENGAASNAFDGNSSTIWHTEWSAANPLPPHEIQIDLGATYSMTGFSYLPRQDAGVNGTIKNYEFYVSADGINWNIAVASGTFNGTASVQQVNFSATSGRYIKLRALSEINGGAWTCVAELNVFGTASLTPVDTTSPTTSISAPAANATVSGTVTVSASATDNVAVRKVEILVNGVVKYSATAAPYSFSWDTTAATNGVYTVISKAYDAAGNVGQSSSISVTVNNPVPDKAAPSVSVTAPANNATVSGTVSVSASATDNVAVSKVEILVNGVVTYTATAAPYSFSWDTTATTNGVYTLSSKAYDAAGNVGQSTTVTTTVNNIAVVTPVVISQAGWKLMYVDSQELAGENGAANNAFDGNSSTFWHTEWSAANPLPPHDIQIDLGASYSMTGFSYLPRQDAGTNGFIGKYEFSVSTDGITWISVASGTFNSSTTVQQASFNATTGRYIRLRALSELNGNPWTCVAELNVFGSAVVAPIVIPADTTAPVISISSPLNKATVSGTVTINTSATDSGGVKQMMIYIDSVLKATGYSGKLSWSWNTTSAAKGIHTIKVIAYDAANNQRTKSISVYK